MPSAVADLLDSAGLRPSGAVRWRTPASRDAPGVYVVALTQDPHARGASLAGPPIDVAALRSLLAARAAIAPRRQATERRAACRATWRVLARGRGGPLRWFGRRVRAQAGAAVLHDAAGCQAPARGRVVAENAYRPRRACGCTGPRRRTTPPRSRPCSADSPLRPRRPHGQQYMTPTVSRRLRTCARRTAPSSDTASPVPPATSRASAPTLRDEPGCAVISPRRRSQRRQGRRERLLPPQGESRPSR